MITILFPILATISAVCGVIKMFQKQDQRKRDAAMRRVRGY